MLDFGLFLVRLVVGLLFVGHGAQKLFGWFGGGGTEGTAQMFGSLGYRRPRSMALTAGVTEAGAGALFALGLFVPLAAAGIIGMMVNAIAAVHADKGPWVSNGGYEYNLVLMTVATAIAFTGPGTWSLANAFSLEFDGWGGGVFALGVGLVAAALAHAARDRGVAADPDASTLGRSHSATA